MGYETKLYIGSSTSVVMKDKDGKTSTWFEVMAMVDLCKAGYDSEILKIDFKNTDENNYWYFYQGNEQVTEDCYGDKPKPIPINVVLDALKKDYQNDDCRRFKWAIALLESMKDDKQKLEVLFYGH